jgi:hypothetical protein
MSKATCDTITPTRRRALGYGAFAAVCGVLPLAVAEATQPPAGDDTELLAICSSFWTDDRLIQEWDAGLISQEAGEAANNRWWQHIEDLEHISASTLEGLRAKAAVSLRAMEQVAESSSQAEDVGRALLAEVAAWRVQS